MTTSPLFLQLSIDRILFPEKPSWHIEPAAVECSAEKPVGRGNFGTVFKGKFRGQDVAVKKLFCQRMSSNAKIETEIQIDALSFMAEMNHPSIVLFVHIFSSL